MNSIAVSNAAVMADLVSVPVVKPSTFLALKQEAKADLTQDMNLDKAADLAAQRRALLDNDTVPAGLKQAQLKQLNRKVALWTKKVRQPFGEGSDVGGLGGDEAAVNPTQTMIKALINTIKSPEATPTISRPPRRRRPADELTPVSTPPTRQAKKKAKLVLGAPPSGIPVPTPPARKRLLPPTPGPSSTPLSAPPVLEPTPKSKSKSVADKGKKAVKKYVKKKGRKAAVDAAKKWLDF